VCQNLETESKLKLPLFATCGEGIGLEVNAGKIKYGREERARKSHNIEDKKQIF
jgi:hypothetical protein